MGSDLIKAPYVDHARLMLTGALDQLPDLERDPHRKLDAFNQHKYHMYSY
jgi:hypothetical protein